MTGTYADGGTTDSTTTDSAATARTRAAADRTAPIRVVLIEDHLNVREQLVRLLRQVGIEVVAVAGSLADGLDAVRLHRPDVVVLDNHLPDGLGIDLCRRLTEHHPHVITVLYSAQLTWGDDERARRAGAVAVVPKSFNAHELIESINHACSTVRQS